MSFNVSVDILVDSQPPCMSVYIVFSLVTNNTKKLEKNTEILNVLFKNTTVEFVSDQMHEKLNPLAEYRPVVGRYINWPPTDYRPASDQVLSDCWPTYRPKSWLMTVDRYITDIWLISHWNLTDTQSRCICPITTNGQLIVGRYINRPPTTDQLSVNRVSTDYWQTLGWHMMLSIDYRPT